MSTQEGEVAAPEPAGPGSPARAVEPLRPDDPAQIHQYALVGRFPGRHVSDVFLAQSGAYVVVKLTPAAPGDPVLREPLDREVRNAKRVRSPRVARILGSGEWQGRSYVVQEFVDGPTLGELMLARGWQALEPADVARLATGLAEALVAVRAADVVHRDLTPANVIVHVDRGPMLVDFGISRATDDPRVTRQGYALGTPGYLSPEQLRGGYATAASDVFQWGLVIGLVLLGRHPVLGVMDDDGRLRPEWADALLAATPDPGLHGRLGRLVEQALAPVPDDRPSPAALLEGVEATALLRVEQPTTAIPLATPRLREARTLREAWQLSADARQQVADAIADRWWAFACLLAAAALAGGLLGLVLALLVAGLAA
jgi:serine/threonine protein kinase